MENIVENLAARMPKRQSRLTRALNPGVYERPDGNLQAVIKVPADVQFAVGKTFKTVSLRTKDPAQANRNHAKMVAEYEAKFDQIRRGTASNGFERFARKLHEFQAKEIGRISDQRLHGDDVVVNVYTSASAGLRLNTDEPDELLATVGWAADWFYAELLDVDVVDLPPSLRETRGYRQVLRECAEVLKDSWRAGREADLGRPVTPPRYPALNKGPDESADGNRAVDDRATWPLSRYFEEVYLPDRSAALGPDTVKVKKQSVELFNALVGDPPLYLVTRSQVSGYQSDLKFLPDARMVTGELKAKSKSELVKLQRAAKTDLKRLGVGTIVKHVGNIKELLAHALSEGHIRLNPTLGMRNAKATSTNPSVDKRPFSLAELEAIFAQPLFAGCKADTVTGVYRPGTLLIRDERFWVPMLLFLTGARASEVAGLERQEVTIEEDHIRLIFQHTKLRRLKNDESERVIPLHPWAAEMGFADYVRSLPSSSTALFPKLVAGSVNKTTGALDEERLNGSSVFRQFNRTLLNHVGLKDDPAVSLHSFRHVFEDAMTGQDIPNEVMFRLTGRSIGSSRAIYARSLPADEGRRAERARDYLRHVERISFGGLDLSHLNPASTST